MAESSESLTSEQESVLSEVEQMVLAAVSDRCTGCSTANFTPGKIARAVATGRVSEGVAQHTAERFANCPGLSEETIPSLGELTVKMCHYPQRTTPEA